MGAREITTAYRMAQWAKVIQDRNASGELIKTYCQSRGISRDSYYYWQRRLRDAACEQLTKIQTEPIETGLIHTKFTEIKILDDQNPIPYKKDGNQGNLMVEVMGIKITADSAYPTDKLGYLLRELVKQ